MTSHCTNLEDQIDWSERQAASNAGDWRLPQGPCLQPLTCLQIALKTLLGCCLLEAQPYKDLRD